MINVNQVKSQIINLLDQNGPSLPIRISREIKLSPVFTSAILSELVNERKVKLSSLKIGSSPLYLIPGQEKKLEAFSDELTGIEKTAFLKLKQNKILKDKEQEPALRVALRNLKDFATPLKYNNEIIWKYSFIPTFEIEQILQNSNNEKEPIQEKIPEKEKIEGIIETESSKQEKSETQEEQKLSQEKPEEEIKEENKKSEINKEESPPTQQEKSETQEKPKKKHSPEQFLENAKDYLLAKDIEFLKKIEVNKKDFTAIVRINSDLGKIKFLLYAKDKKRPNIADLTMAHQKASNEKMPCLFLSTGEPASTTKDFLNEHKNLMKIEIMEN